MSHARRPTSSRWLGLSVRGWVFVILLAAYVVLTVLVIVPSPVLDLDKWLLDRHLWYHHPGWHPWLKGYVIFGQRGPATLFFLPFFFWVAWRQRSSRPLVLLVTALILLNVSIGIVKIITGRIGPLFQNDEHVIFAGGNIYPSGHVSNVIVLYALITWIAPKYRRTLIVITVWLSLSVGLATVYLRTHWFSDVVGGWMAGALVLLALPTVMPFAQRATDRAGLWVHRGLRRTNRPRRLVRRVYGWADRHIPRPAPPRASLPATTPARPMVNATSTGGTGQVKGTPVNSAAKSQSFSAITVPSDAFDESTRRGEPRTSPTSSGP